MARKSRQQAQNAQGRSAPQKTNPPRPGSRRARKLRNSAERASVTLVGGASAGGFEPLPVARSFRMGQPGRYDIKALANHPTHGRGVVVSGCEVGLNVVTAAAGADFFTSSVATAATVNVLQISPDTFNGRLALTARTYTRYRFRRLLMHFVPALGTANPGLAAVGYTPDGVQGGFATQSFAQVSQMEPSAIFSLNAPMTIDVINYKGDDLWFTEYDSATSAGVRSTIQGEIVGFPSVNNLGVLTQGVMFLEFVVELYSPTTDYGFTLSREETKLATAYIKKLRENMAKKPSSLPDDFEHLSVASTRR